MADRLPDWLVVGPPRTGTTWLHGALRERRDVFVAREKQLHFFDREFGRGPAWYAGHFDDAPGGTPAGELTPDYFSHPDAPRRIGEVLGRRVRLVVVVRDPVERAWSDWRMRRRVGVLEGVFTEALASDPVLSANSRYGENLGRLLEEVGSEQLRLVSFHLLERDPAAFLNAFLEAVGVEGRVDAVEGARASRAPGATPAPRWPGVDRVLARLRRTAERSALGRPLVRVIQGVGLPRIWHALVHDPAGAPELDPVARARAEEILAGDVARFRRRVRAEGLSWAGDPAPLMDWADAGTSAGGPS